MSETHQLLFHIMLNELYPNIVFDEVFIRATMFAVNGYQSLSFNNLSLIGHEDLQTRFTDSPLYALLAEQIATTFIDEHALEAELLIETLLDTEAMRTYEESLTVDPLGQSETSSRSADHESEFDPNRLGLYQIPEGYEWFDDETQAQIEQLIASGISVDDAIAMLQPDIHEFPGGEDDPTAQKKSFSEQPAPYVIGEKYTTIEAGHKEGYTR